MSIFSRFYNRISWKNYPDLSTPINERNLNNMDAAIYELDGKVVTLSKNIQNTIAAVSYDRFSDKLVITYTSGYQISFSLNSSKVVVNFKYDPETQSLILVHQDGTTQSVSIADFVASDEFEDSDTIKHYKNGEKEVFKVKDGSIDETKLEPKYLAKLNEQADRGYLYVAESEANYQGTKSYYEKSKKISQNVDTIERDVRGYADKTLDLYDMILQKMENGEFIGEKGEKGDRGESGFYAPIDNYFYLSIDGNGDLYAITNNDDTPLDFELDENGDLYIIFQDTE